MNECVQLLVLQYHLFARTLTVCDKTYGHRRRSFLRWMLRAAKDEIITSFRTTKSVPPRERQEQVCW